MRQKYSRLGKPVPVVDLAEQMIRARGLRPGQDIPIEFVGIRPGEKICEELLAADEEQVPTDHPSIFRIRRTAPLNLEGFDGQIDRLLSMSENGTNAGQIRAELKQCVQRLQSTRLEPADKYLAEGVVTALETVREA